MNAADLLLRIVADTSSMKKDLNGAKAAIDGFSNSAMTSLLKLGSAFGGLFAGTKIAAAIQDTVKSIDDMAASAERLGVGVESFQQLSFAAKFADTDVAALESNMSRLQKTLGQAKEKGFEVGSVFDKLGLNAEYLYRQEPDKQFLAVAKALGKVKNQADKVNFGNQLFGKGFKEILPLVNADIGEITKRFKSLNAALSGEQVGNVNKLDETQKTLDTLMGGVGKQVVAEIAKPWEFALRGVENYIVSLGGAEAASLQLSQTFLSSVQFMLAGFNSLSFAADTLKEGLTSIVESFVLLGRTAGVKIAEKVDRFSKVALSNDQKEIDRVTAEGAQRSKEMLDPLYNAFGERAPDTNGIRNLMLEVDKQKIAISERQRANQTKTAVMNGNAVKELYTDNKGSSFADRPVQNVNVKLEIGVDSKGNLFALTANSKENSVAIERGAKQVMNKAAAGTNN